MVKKNRREKRDTWALALGAGLAFFLMFAMVFKNLGLALLVGLAFGVLSAKM